MFVKSTTTALSYIHLSVKSTKEPWADLLHRHLSVYLAQKIFAVYNSGKVSDAEPDAGSSHYPLLERGLGPARPC